MVRQFSGLPPKGICLVHDLQYVTFLEAHASIGAGDVGVLLWAVIDQGPHVELTARKCRDETEDEDVYMSETGRSVEGQYEGRGFTMVLLWTGLSVIGMTLKMMVPCDLAC